MTTDKDVDWRGDSKEILKEWPEVAKENIGADLRRLQQGKMPKNWKPFPGLKGNAFELRDKDGNKLYRVIYVTLIKSKIVVLNSFTKTSEKTEQPDVNAANQRLKELLEEQTDLKRKAKKKGQK